MKKILYLILILYLSVTAAYAESNKVHVAAISEFSTANPPSTIDVDVLESCLLGSYYLKEGDIIHCNVIKVTKPKRGKRAASFVVYPNSYTSDEKIISINENYYGKYSKKIISKEELKKIDKAKVGKKAVLTAGNFFMKGFSSAVSMAEGMIENNEGNRIESGVKKVYKDSPLSYVEKGQELNIEPGETFYLIFKPSNGKKLADITESALNKEN